MLTFLLSLFGIILTICIVVGVHEFGHFIVARLLGIKVLRFSIGFGKAIYKRYDKKGTEYVLAPIPLGGYVKLLDENEAPVAENEKHLAFNRQPLYKRFLVILAGPLFNVLLAFIIYWLVYMIGFTTLIPIIGEVAPHSIAEKAGLKPQQEILRIDNRVTSSWTNVIVRIFLRAGETEQMQFQIKNLADQTIYMRSLNLITWHMDELKPDPLQSLGITPYTPPIPMIIGVVQPNSPATSANLAVGDKIIAVETIPKLNWDTLVDKIAEHPNETLSFTIQRDKKVFNMPVTIGYHRDLFFQKTGFLGISPKFSWPENLLRKNKYGPLAAMPHALQNITDLTYLNFIVLGKLFTGKLSLKSLSGPVAIFEGAGISFNAGIIPFLSFLAFLSISIGIINVLPIPGLDGGHLLFQLLEFILRRPVPLHVQALFYRFGMIILLLIVMQAVINDIMRL